MIGRISKYIGESTMGIAYTEANYENSGENDVSKMEV